jgi:drug/metabolite transporter (DMT)-like permease
MSNLLESDLHESDLHESELNETHHHKSHLKTYLLLPVIVILAPLGNVLLSKGMKAIGPDVSWSPSYLLPTLILILTSGYIWLGIAAQLGFFVAYMLVLSWADYSYIQPASALSYAVVSLLGYFWLGEAVSPLRWVGIGIICAGVLIVVVTPHTTHKATQRASQGTTTSAKEKA